MSSEREEWPREGYWSDLLGWIPPNQNQPVYRNVFGIPIEVNSLLPKSMVGMVGRRYDGEVQVVVADFGEGDDQ